MNRARKLIQKRGVSLRGTRSEIAGVPLAEWGVSGRALHDVALTGDEWPDAARAPNGRGRGDDRGAYGARPLWARRRKELWPYGADY